MHMADALVAPVVAGTMYVCSTLAATYSVKKVGVENEPKKNTGYGSNGGICFLGTDD